MFGAIANSIEASKDYIYPKVTTLKRVKSIYTVSLIFFFLIQQQRSHSSDDCQCSPVWESTLCTENALGVEAGDNITTDTTSLQKTCDSTQGLHGGCK